MTDSKPEPSDIDELRCHGCGFVDPDPDDTSVNECPECGASFNNFWVEKIFVDTSGTHDMSEQDIEDAELVGVSEISRDEERQFSVGGCDE